MNHKSKLALALMAVAAWPAAWAQTPTPNTAATAPAAGSAREATPAPAARTAGTNADARRCLELATNSEVIRCAEKYLPRRRNG